MTSHPTAIGDEGVRPLSAHWGEEVASMWVEDPALFAPLAAAGVPRVIEVAVPMGLTRHSYKACAAVVAGFDRACRWASMTRQPVIYAVRDRDRDAAPLPAPGHADVPHHWRFASTWELLHAPTRVENGPCFYWGRDDFLPLPLLLEGQFNAALVPVFWLADGPPIVL